MRTERNIANILIAKNGTKTLTASGNIDDYISGMNTGEPVVLSAGGVIVDATGTLPTEIKIATKLVGGTLNYSDLIKISSIKSIQVNRYAAATTQLDYIGYNGTANSIEAINNNIYTVRLYMKPTDTAAFMQQKIKRGVYKSDSSATQAEIAAGLTSSLIYNFSREPEKLKYGANRIKFERVASGTSTATSGGVLSVTNGSKYVSIAGTGADAGMYNTDGATIVAGDYIRFGHATTKTYPVYRVDEVVSGGGATTMVVKLDIPYQGTTDLALAAASAGVIPAATALAGDFGIKLTGSVYAFDPPKFNYVNPRWETTLQDCGTTVVTNSTKATEGQGDYHSVSMMEQQFQGNEGNFYRAQVPSPTFRTETLSTATYAMIVIEFEDAMASTIGGYERSYKQLYIACEKAATGTHFTDANTGLATILTAYVTAGTKCNVTNVATEIAA